MLGLSRRGPSVSESMRASTWLFLSFLVGSLQTSLCSQGRPRWIFLPETKPAEKCIIVVAGARAFRQFFEFLDIASSKNDIVRFEGGDQAGHSLNNFAAPFLGAVLFQCAHSDIILKGFLSVGKMAHFQRFHNSVENQRGSQPSSKAEEEHLAAFIAPQRLHGRIINDLHWMSERSLKVETHPARSQVTRFGNWLAQQDWPGIANRHHVILPIVRDFQNA